MTYLDKLRHEIDNIDREIVKLFEKRMAIVTDVAKYKIEKDLPILNTLRESEVIEKNIEYLKDKELSPYLKEFYIKLMDISKDYQRVKIEKTKSHVNVCFQGSTGSFSEEALFEYFGDKAIAHPVKEFEDVFKKLKDDDIEYGVLPIENSSTGAINEVYDLLRKYGLYIVGNMTLQINHNLMAIDGTELKDIKTVYSHPQAFEQCSKFLKDKKLELIPYYNTAVSAEFVKKEKSKSIAAIGSKKAAEVNGLKIVKDNINNNHNNYTRFVIISKTLEYSDVNDAISIVFSSPNKVGALYDSLNIFKKNNLNMIRIESRPIVGKPWEYFFYIDFEGDINNEHVKEAMAHIRDNSNYYKLLGNYKK